MQYIEYNGQMVPTDVYHRLKKEEKENPNIQEEVIEKEDDVNVIGITDIEDFGIDKETREEESNNNDIEDFQGDEEDGAIEEKLEDTSRFGNIEDWTKSQIIGNLYRNNISYNQSMNKKELFNLMNKYA